MALDRALQIDPENEEALAMKASLQRTSPSLSPQERIITSLQTIKQLHAINPSHPQVLVYTADHHFWRWSTLPALTATATKGSVQVTLEGEGVSSLHPALPLRINNTVCRIKSSQDAVTATSCVLASPFTGESGAKLAIEVRDTATCMQLAKECLKEAKMSTVKSEAYELLGRCYHALNNWSHAKEMYDKAIHANKRNLLAQYEMIQVWVSRERLRDRLIHLSAVARTKKEKEDLRIQARAHCSTCSQIGGTNNEIAFLASYLQFKSNELPKAMNTIAAVPDVGLSSQSDA